MEAKDTVMSEEEQDSCTPTDEESKAYLGEPDDEVAAKLRATYPEMFRVIGRCLLYGRKIAKAQTEISFKAGEKAGARKVVEWGNEKCMQHGHVFRYKGELLSNTYRRECSLCWQAFVKGLGGE